MNELAMDSLIHESTFFSIYYATFLSGKNSRILELIYVRIDKANSLKSANSLPLGTRDGICANGHNQSALITFWILRLLMTRPDFVCESGRASAEKGR